MIASAIGRGLKTVPSYFFLSNQWLLHHRLSDLSDPSSRSTSPLSTAMVAVQGIVLLLSRIVSHVTRSSILLVASVRLSYAFVNKVVNNDREEHGLSEPLLYDKGSTLW